MNQRVRVATRHGLAAASFVVLHLFTRSVSAQPQTPPVTASATEDEAAARLKEQGDAEMDSLHYDSALAKFDQALAVAKDSTLRARIIYNRGRTLQAMGNYPLALEAFESFDKNAPADLKAKVTGFATLVEDTRIRVATIRVVCNVQGAEVRVAQRVVGTCSEGSAVVRVNAGPVHLEVKSEGFFPFVKDLDVKGKETTTVNVTLLSSATKGALRIESVEGALAALDGKDMGLVPVDASVDPGNHEVEISKSGFASVKKTILVVSGQKQLVKVDSLPDPAVTSRPWFWITVGSAVAVVGAAVAVVIWAATTEKSPTPGNIQPGIVSTGAFRF